MQFIDLKQVLAHKKFLKNHFLCKTTVTKDGVKSVTDARKEMDEIFPELENEFGFIERELNPNSTAIYCVMPITERDIARQVMESRFSGNIATLKLKHIARERKRLLFAEELKKINKAKQEVTKNIFLRFMKENGIKELSLDQHDDMVVDYEDGTVVGIDLDELKIN